jgi:hypothetical protein
MDSNASAACRRLIASLSKRVKACGVRRPAARAACAVASGNSISIVVIV